jgi:general secretion pathway protein M
MTPWKAVILRWQRLSAREQWALRVLGVFVLSVAAFNLIWQPVQQRLAIAERQYQHQLALAALLQRARPHSSVPEPTDQPLSLRLNESAATAGLELHQMDTDADLLRLTLSGDAKALLSWLDQIEREGVALLSLTLEKRDTVLHAQVLLRQ